MEKPTCQIAPAEDNTIRGKTLRENSRGSRGNSNNRGGSNSGSNEVMKLLKPIQEVNDSLALVAIEKTQEELTREARLEEVK